MSGNLYRSLFRYLKKNSVSCSRVFIRRFSLPNENSSIPRSSSHLYNDREIKYSKRSSRDIEKKIKFKGNPDVFGNLTDRLAKEEEIENMPEEEGDVIRQTFYDDRVGKTKLRISQYAHMIKKYLEDNKVYEAISVLEVRMIKEDKVAPDSYIYNLLINGCAKVGYTQKAFKLFNDMKKRGLKVGGTTYTSLFNACALSRIPGDGLKRAIHLKELIEEKLYQPNRSNYHAMMKAFGHCEDLVTAFSIVDEMISKGIPIKQDTFCFLLQACLSDKENGFRHAIMVWRKLRERGVQPSVFCYNLMLRSARDCHIGDSAALFSDLNLLTDDKESEIKLLTSGSESSQMESNLPETRDVSYLPAQLPNFLAKIPEVGSVVSIKSITQPTHRLMLLGGSDGVLKQMEADGVKPDIKTATILLDMVPGTGEAELKLIETLRKFGVSLDVDFCNMLIKKRCYNRQFKAAKEVLQLISELKLIPNLMTYGVLALSCRNMEQANQLLNDLESSGLRLNIEIIGGLMYAARYSWNVELVLVLMDKIVKEEIKVSQAYFVHLEKFRDLIQRHIEFKNQGKPYHMMIDKTSFMKLYNRFLSEFNLWSKVVELDDRDTIHPWKQFKKPYAAEQ